MVQSARAACQPLSASLLDDNKEAYHRQSKVVSYNKGRGEVMKRNAPIKPTQRCALPTETSSVVRSGLLQRLDRVTGQMDK